MSDLVERLRIEINQWKELADIQRAEIERLRAEIDRLRAERQELAVLVRRLALAFRKAQPEHAAVADSAMDYLRRAGLGGDVLR